MTISAGHGIEIGSSMALVSILIPTFNQEPAHIQACIESAIAQDYPNIEVVVSDNHSSGESLEFLQSLSDPRVRIVKPPQFVSMTENFGFCARSAHGEFISFLSSDDTLVTSAISEMMIMMMTHPEIVFCCGNAIRGQQYPTEDMLEASLVRPSRQPTRTYTSEEAEDFFFPWGMSSTWIPGDLIRRDAYERTGGFENCTLGIVSDIWLARGLIAQGGFGYLARPLAFYRARPANSRYVDPTRPLLELTDQITLRATTADLAPAHRINRWMHHIYLIDRLPAPSGAASKAWDDASVAFRAGQRSDLAKALEFYRRHPLIWKALASFLRVPVKAKSFWDARRFAKHHS